MTSGPSPPVDRRPGDDESPSPRLPAFSIRSVILLLVFLVAGALWVRQVSLISYTCQVAEGTPSVPALTALILLGAAALIFPWLARSRALRRESLMIYLVLSLALPMSCANVMRQLFPALTALRYFAQPENNYAQFAQLLPSWIAPTNEEAIRTFYEGSEHGAIPWAAWRTPLLTWTAVFLVFSLSLYCLVALFRKPWADHERLTYPLAELALNVAPGGTAPHSSRPLLAHSLFWLGFALSALFNLTNILHAFQPQVVALGTGYDLGAIFTQKPWSGIRPLYLAHRPEIVGLGYLVPVDILFSTWLFYLILRLENLVAGVFGYSIAGFPFDGPQGFGAYLGLAIFVVYAARKHLAGAFLAAADPRRASDDREEPLPYRLAVWGFVGGLVMVVGLCVAAGMSPGKSIIYIVLSYAVMLVYSRIRAQTGVPISYVVPRDDIGWAMLDMMPTGGEVTAQQVRGEVAFALMNGLNRLTFPHIAAFETEGIRLADRVRIRRAHLFAAVVLGILLGVASGYATHLTAYYSYGCNVLDGGTTQGGWRTRQALIEYERVQSRTTSPTPVNWPPLIARGAGLAITGLLLLLRSRFLRFPIHPMGLAMAATFGYHTWFPLFLAWLCKVLILRLGGARLYRVASSAFFGLAVGHFVCAGAVWGLVGIVKEDVARRYLVWFA